MVLTFGAHAEKPSPTSPPSRAPAAGIFFVVLATAVFLSLSCIAAHRVALRSSFRQTAHSDDQSTLWRRYACGTR